MDILGEVTFTANPLDGKDTDAVVMPDLFEPVRGLLTIQDADYRPSRLVRVGQCGAVLVFLGAVLESAYVLTHNEDPLGKPTPGTLE